jgi:hypothetical protein
MLSVSSLLTVLPAKAQTIPKPAVPEFTLSFADKSYDVPPITRSTTDPYNNKTTTTTTPGRHVKDYEIEMTIKNQPYPSSINGNASNLYYYVQSKGHYENWTEAYSRVDFPENLHIQSDAGNTTLLFSANNFPSDAQVDFRVKAILGYTYNSFLSGHIMPIPTSDFVFEEGDWSSTKTFDMSSVQAASPPPNPYSVEVTIIAVLIAATVIVSLLVILSRKIMKKPTTSKQPTSTAA